MQNFGPKLEMDTNIAMIVQRQLLLNRIQLCLPSKEKCTNDHVY